MSQLETLGHTRTFAGTIVVYDGESMKM